MIPLRYRVPARGRAHIFRVADNGKPPYWQVYFRGPWPSDVPGYGHFSTWGAAFTFVENLRRERARPN